MATDRNSTTLPITSYIKDMRRNRETRDWDAYVIRRVDVQLHRIYSAIFTNSLLTIVVEYKHHWGEGRWLIPSLFPSLSHIPTSSNPRFRLIPMDQSTIRTQSYLVRGSFAHFGFPAWGSFIIALCRCSPSRCAALRCVLRW